jgi:hypothetical protein
MWQGTKLQNSAQSGSASVPTQFNIFLLTLYLKKTSSNKIIQIKLARMPMISYFTKPRLFNKCNRPLVLSIQWIINFKFRPLSTFVFLGFHRNYVIKVVHHSKICQHTTSTIPRWLVQGLHPPKKFGHPPFWNGWSYWTKIYQVEVISSGLASLLNFIKLF